MNGAIHVPHTWQYCDSRKGVVVCGRLVHEPNIAVYEDGNAKANEFLYCRVDIEDVVSAHLLAMEKARSIGFARYVISATSPFSQYDRLRCGLVSFNDQYPMSTWVTVFCCLADILAEGRGYWVFLDGEISKVGRFFISSALCPKKG